MAGLRSIPAEETTPDSGNDNAVTAFPCERLGDPELVQAIARGDSPALGVVWDRHSGTVRGVIRSTMGPDSVVEDLVQEVFLVLLRSASQLRDRSALRAFLVSVAIRITRVELRRRRVRRWITLSPTGDVPDAPVAAGDTESGEALKALYRLMGTLSSRRRLAFGLRCIHGMEIGEVAASLGISESTAKREILRAREAILFRAERTEPALWQWLEAFGGSNTRSTTGGVEP